MALRRSFLSDSSFLTEEIHWYSIGKTADDAGPALYERSWFQCRSSELYINDCADNSREDIQIRRQNKPERYLDP